MSLQPARQIRTKWKLVFLLVKWKILYNTKNPLEFYKILSNEEPTTNSSLRTVSWLNLLIFSMIMLLLCSSRSARKFRLNENLISMWIARKFAQRNCIYIEHTFKSKIDSANLILTANFQVHGRLSAMDVANKQVFSPTE